MKLILHDLTHYENMGELLSKCHEFIIISICQEKWVKEKGH